ISTQNDALHLDFVVPAFGKERPNGPIGQTRSKNLFLSGAAFTFEVAARKLAGGSGFFTVINGQRKEVLARFGLGRPNGGNEDDGFAQLDRYSAVRLLGEFSGFDGYLLVPEGDRNFM